MLEIEALSEMMDHIFQRPHQLFHLGNFQANILYQGAKSQKLHMNTPFPEPVPPWPAKANNIWLLDDFTEENGATEVVGGSHKLDYKPLKDDDVNIEVAKATAPMGSVLFTRTEISGIERAQTIPGAADWFAVQFCGQLHEGNCVWKDQSLIIFEEIKSTRLIV